MDVGGANQNGDLEREKRAVFAGQRSCGGRILCRDTKTFRGCGSTKVIYVGGLDCGRGVAAGRVCGRVDRQLGQSRERFRCDDGERLVGCRGSRIAGRRDRCGKTKTSCGRLGSCLRRAVVAVAGSCFAVESERGEFCRGFQSRKQCFELGRSRGTARSRDGDDGGVGLEAAIGWGGSSRRRKGEKVFARVCSLGSRVDVGGLGRFTDARTAANRLGDGDRDHRVDQLVFDRLGIASDKRSENKIGREFNFEFDREFNFESVRAFDRSRRLRGPCRIGDAI